MGPQLIYCIIVNTHVESILSTCDLLQDSGQLDLKKFGYNIKKMHAEGDHLRAQLKANKAEPDDLTIMMHLIAEHCTNISNTQFLQHVANLESDWSWGVIGTSTPCETHVNTMIWNGNWRVQCAPKSEPTALALDANKQPEPCTQDSQYAITKLTSKNAAWKFMPSEFTQTTLMKNGKMYHWCTALSIKRSACGSFTSLEPVMAQLLSILWAHPKPILQHEAAFNPHKVARAKTSSRLTLPKL